MVRGRGTRPSSCSRRCTGEIRALWVLGTNPAVSLPDGNRVREALSRCELLVVSEVTANTDTARLAHLLLPAAAWGEERHRHQLRAHHQPPARLPAPAGEARPDWWALTRLARRLGFGEGFAYEHEHGSSASMPPSRV